MDLADALDFVNEHHRAVLATSRPDGHPQLSPVTVALDASRHVVISTRETAIKTRHLRRDPHASLCVLQDGFFGPFVQLEGEAEVLTLPDAMPSLIDYYRSAAGEHPDWGAYRQAMQDERRVLIRINVTRVGPTISG